jgi:hypothetical protein
MGAEEELAGSLAKFDATAREYADRRALRERDRASASAQVKDGLAKQGAMMQKFVEHYVELGKRKRKAGGWETSSALEERQVHFTFSGEDSEASEEEETVQTPAPQPKTFPRPEYPQSLSGEALFTPHHPDEGAQEASDPAERPTDALPVRKPKPEPARKPPSRRPVVEEDFDEDDFSSNQWMR